MKFMEGCLPITTNVEALLMLGYSGVYRSALNQQLNSEQNDQHLTVQPQ